MTCLVAAFCSELFIVIVCAKMKCTIIVLYNVWLLPYINSILFFLIDNRFIMALSKFGVLNWKNSIFIVMTAK